MSEQLFSEGLVLDALSAVSFEDAISLLGKLLEDKGYIADSYVDAVLEREKNFPTGIALEGLGVAIPHATPEGNVKNSAVAIAKLKNSVAFRAMEDPDETVDVDYVFLLALSDGGAHLEILKKMFSVFQNGEVIEKMKAATEAKAIYSVLTNALDTVE